MLIEHEKEKKKNILLTNFNELFFPLDPQTTTLPTSRARNGKKKPFF